MDKKLLTRLSKEQINELVDHLLGSGVSLDDGLEVLGLTFDQVHPDSFTNLDSRIFKCDACSRWCNEDENTGESICDYCREVLLDISDGEEKDCEHEEGILIDYANEEVEDEDFPT